MLNPIEQFAVNVADLAESIGLADCMLALPPESEQFVILALAALQTAEANLRLANYCEMQGR